MLYLLHSHFASSRILLNPLLVLMLDAYPLQVGWLAHPLLYPLLDNTSNIYFGFLVFPDEVMSCVDMFGAKGVWNSFLSTMHPGFSHMMDVGLSCTYPTSATSCLSQIASFVQRLVAMHCAYVVDNAIVGFFLYFHGMTSTPTRNTYPVVDRRSFASHAQSASQNP